MEELIPALKQKAKEELQRVTKALKESGKFEDDDDGDYDDLIAKLVERAMEKIKVKARNSLKVEHFLIRLTVAKKNVTVPPPRTLRRWPSRLPVQHNAAYRPQGLVACLAWR